MFRQLESERNYNNMEVKVYYQVQVKARTSEAELLWSGINHSDYEKAVETYNQLINLFPNNNYRIIKVTEQKEVVN